MDRLPLEITHVIIQHFRHCRESIASLRLVCKSFAAVGLYYFIPEVHLLFKSSSFQFLKEVSEHPVLSKQVESVLFEADSVIHYSSFKEWKNNIISSDPSSLREREETQLPSRASSDRERRALCRAFRKAIEAPRTTYSKSRLKAAYEHYKEYVADQSRIRDQGYNQDLLTGVMRQLPNLKSLSLSMHHCFTPGDWKKRLAFSNGLSVASGDAYQVAECGVPQLRCLLLSALHACVRIRNLACGSVNWAFFKQDDEIFGDLKLAIRDLSGLDMYVTTRNEDNDWEDENPQLEVCASYLRESCRIEEFVTSAPHLNRLSMNFEGNNEFLPARLCDIVGEFKWVSLTYTAFTEIDAAENDLIAFYSRHAQTLKEIVLSCVNLYDGRWPTLLQRARKTLNLSKATICGDITSDQECYCLDLPPEINGNKKSAIGVALESYLIVGGDGPLLDLYDMIEELERPSWDNDSLASADEDE